MIQAKPFRNSSVITLLIAFLMVAAANAAQEPKSSQSLDLAQIRGFNYVPSSARNDIEFWRDYDKGQVEHELDFAQRLRLNQARVFLNYTVYEREPAIFLERVRHFVRAAKARGIGTMVVVWDQCCYDEMPDYSAHEQKWYPNPGPKRLGPDFWPAGEIYAQDLVKTLSGQPGLEFWEIMNEPRSSQQDVRAFIEHFAKVFRELDPRTPITVGAATLQDMDSLAGTVDVLSFHDYSSTREVMMSNIQHARATSRKYGKPVMCTETGTLARANPYDMTLEILQRAHLGWYIWELMVSQKSQWSPISGVVFPDGTVRDPSTVAALIGFFREGGTELPRVALDQERAVTRTVAAIDKWLEQKDPSWADGLKLAEVAANLLEAGQLVPMNDPPIRELERLRMAPPDLAALRKLVIEWRQILERYRQT